jgi:hypothetical protein
MANQQPTVADLQALIQTLQAQVLVLQNAAPAIQAAPAAAQVVFADTPQMLGVDNLIDYSTKLGKDIYNHGCGALDDKALTNRFSMTPGKTVVFVEASQCHADSMGWTIGQLELDPKVSAIAEEGKKKGNKGDKGDKGKKWKNKKNTSNKKDQKRDETRKRVPPKENEKKKIQVGKYTYNWCKHHMAWTIHKPSNCELGKKHKVKQKKDHNKANSAVIASVATTTISPHYAALLATLANQDEEE